MRITTGFAKNKKIEHPTWFTTRPMMEKVRESLFSVIQFIITDTTILDLYAGTGILGLEALSRGARSAVFVDINRRCTDLIKQNSAIVGVEDKVAIHTVDAKIFLNAYHGPLFDIVFFMPPYAYFSLPLLEKAATFISTSGVLVTEWLRKETLPEQLGHLHCFKKRNFGQTTLWFYEVAPEEI